MEWISVKDKMPEYEAYVASEEFVHVLVYIGGVVCCGMYCNGVWEAMGARRVPVTHWMPLPKPPTY